MSRHDKIHPLVGGKVMVRVAQLVRALDCGSRGRGFKSPLSPSSKRDFGPGAASSVRAITCRPIRIVSPFNVQIQTGTVIETTVIGKDLKIKI